MDYDIYQICSIKEYTLLFYELMYIMLYFPLSSLPKGMLKAQMSQTRKHEPQNPFSTLFDK